MTRLIPTDEALAALFNPRAVAVIGVSKDPLKRGRQVLRNVVAGGFGGRIFGIGRNVREADGVPCFPSLDDLPEPVDTAFLAVPADATAETLRQCRAAGIRVAIVGAAGFAENADAKGSARQAALEQAQAETGIRIVGPNCNGVYNTANRLALGFNAAHSIKLKPGNIAIISHSGALFSVMAGYLDHLRGGISTFVSCGNETDLDTLDYLAYAIDDPNTKVVALLIDALSHGERLRTLGCKATALGKRIVALKVGASEAGAKAALAHSSRLAGDAAAYAALFEASGIAQAATLEELMTTAAVLGLFGRTPGGLGAFSTSGLGASMIADIAVRHGAPLPALSAETQRRMAPFLSFSIAGNPIDLGLFERGKSAEVPKIVAADPAIGAMLAVINPIDPNSGVITLTEDLACAKATSNKPLVLVVPGGLPREKADHYAAQGLPVFPDTEATVAAMSALVAPPPEPLASESEIPDSRKIEIAASLSSTALLNEPESLALLGDHGINVVPTTVCRNVDEAIASASSIGWPVVAKAVVEGLAHKTEAGLVRTDIRNADTLREACIEFGLPNRIAIQPFIRGRAEAIAGVTWSADVGLILLAGIGGIYAEALRDIVMWAIPASLREIERKLRASALGRIITSPRWGSSNAWSALIVLLDRLQSFARIAEPNLKAIDINPIILTDREAIAVDALIVPRGQAGRSLA